jgi:hypothetical protein
MSENEEPDWLAELTKNANALRQQIEESSEALRHQVDQLVRSAEQFARHAHRPLLGGPVPPFQQRVVRAAGSLMRELVPPASYLVGGAGIKGYAVSSTGMVTVSGSLALPPMRTVASADVVRASENQAVAVASDWWAIGRICALVLVAIETWRLLGLPERDWAAVEYRLAVLGFALAIATVIWSILNKPK